MVPGFDSSLFKRSSFSFDLSFNSKNFFSELIFKSIQFFISLSTLLSLSFLFRPSCLIVSYLLSLAAYFSCNSDIFVISAINFFFRSLVIVEFRLACGAAASRSKFILLIRFSIFSNSLLISNN